MCFVRSLNFGNYVVLCFYFCDAPSAFLVIVLGFVIAFGFHHTAPDCEYSGTFCSG